MRGIIGIFLCALLAASAFCCACAPALISEPAPATQTPDPATPTPKPSVSPTAQAPTPKPTATATPCPTTTPKPTPPQPTKAPPLPLTGYVIGIDPGHQAKGDNNTEPESPGSEKMKPRVSSGTEGCVSKVPEYEVTLAVGLLLRDLLTEQGAIVVMTRERNDINISNIERARLFNEKRTDYALRLHCDGDENPQRRGAHILVPQSNPFSEDCNRAAQILLEAYCSETGAAALGTEARGDQTGFNWCERMIINIEMGFMSNKEEDKLLVSRDYQKKMARGILAGIMGYFAQRK